MDEHAKPDPGSSPDDLKNAQHRIAELADREARLKEEVAQLRRANASYQFQFENRVQEDNWSLQKDVERLNALNESLIAQLHQLQIDRERARKRRPTWLRSDHKPDSFLAFVLMPYGPTWFPTILAAIDEALRARGCKCETALKMAGRIIMDDVWKGICSSRVVIADITGNNPNVAYEIGIADHLGKDLILLAQSTNPAEIAFDFRGNRLIPYDPECIEALRLELGKRLDQILGHREDA